MTRPVAERTRSTRLWLAPRTSAGTWRSETSCAHPTLASQYGDSKRKLAQAHPDDIEAYMDGKDGFIKEMES